MNQQNGLDLEGSEHDKDKEKNKNNRPVNFSLDKSKETNGKSISKENDFPSIPKVVLHMDSEQKLHLPLLNMDTVRQGDMDIHPIHYPKTNNSEPESPIYIMEPSDPFLNPELYKRYSICTDIDDTLPERLAKQIENIKDVTRDKAVSSITAGENAVLLLVNTFKYLTSGWLGLVISLVTIFVYGSLGALIFMALEKSPPNVETNKVNTTGLDIIREDMAIKIENILRNETIMKNSTNFVTSIQQILIVYEEKYSDYKKNASNTGIPEKEMWTFSNSFIYAGTIYTTIAMWFFFMTSIYVKGYGNIAPKTLLGRAATIVYAIIGIPLFLVMLTSFGKFLTRIIKFFWACKCYSKRASVQETPVLNDEVYRPSLNEDKYVRNISSPVKRNNETTEVPVQPEAEDEEFNLPISLALSILILYMLCGAVAAHLIEDWSFFDSFYYVFISMSTIGLGDFVISDSRHMIYAILYINFGLSLTAMCIDVVQKNLTVIFKTACDKILVMVDESDSSIDLHESDIR